MRRGRRGGEVEVDLSGASVIAHHHLSKLLSIRITMKPQYKSKFLEKFNNPTGIVIVILLSVAIFSALGYTLPTLPFHESDDTKIFTYGVVSVSLFLFSQYRIFFNDVNGATRYLLVTINYTKARKIWTMVVIVFGTAYLSYMIGYVLSKAMYLPHQIVSTQPIQQKFSMKISPYTTGAFRGYARIYLTNKNYDNLELSWPKEKLLQFNVTANPTFSCSYATLNQTIFGTSVKEIAPCI